MVGIESFVDDTYYDYDEYKDILLNFSKIVYKDGRYSDVVVGIIKYEDKPVILYEVYKHYSYWHVDILDNSFYEVIGKLKAKHAKIEYRKKLEKIKDEKGECGKLSWLAKYRVEENEEGVIEFL